MIYNIVIWLILRGISTRVGFFIKYPFIVFPLYYHILMSCRPPKDKQKWKLLQSSAGLKYCTIEDKSELSVVSHTLLPKLIMKRTIIYINILTDSIFEKVDCQNLTFPFNTNSCCLVQHPIWWDYFYFLNNWHLWLTSWQKVAIK